jgi:hypothetical protein
MKAGRVITLLNELQSIFRATSRSHKIRRHDISQLGSSLALLKTVLQSLLLLLLLLPPARQISKHVTNRLWGNGCFNTEIGEMIVGLRQETA